MWEDEVNGSCSTHWGDETYIPNLCRKTHREDTNRRPSRRREYNIRIVLKEVSCEGVDSFHLTEDRDQ
jgi:hypothetical protein